MPLFINLISGSKSLHQSSEVFGDVARITAVMTYATIPDFEVSQLVHSQNNWTVETVETVRAS
jgi:hypothetical protein